MQKRRASVVKTMTNGILALFKANGVVGIQGHGKLLAGNKVLVKGPTDPRKLWKPSTWFWRPARRRFA